MLQRIVANLLERLQQLPILLEVLKEKKEKKKNLASLPKAPGVGGRGRKDLLLSVQKRLKRSQLLSPRALRY